MPRPVEKPATTHEVYIRRVVELAIEHSSVDVPSFKLVYGAGETRTRGVTYFGRWRNGQPEPEAFVEICAAGEHSPVQLAGITVDELAHVVCGMGAGHGPRWKAACRDLGLRCAKAAGMDYQPAHFAPALRQALSLEPVPTDGMPCFAGNGNGAHQGFRAIPLPPGALVPRPCSSTHGCKGGKSRGKGSGSRMKKLTCEACGYLVRTTNKWASRGLPTCYCGGAFQLAE